MVLGINGQYVPIDVKAMRYDKRFDTYCTGNKKPAPGVYLVVVNPETQEIRWAYSKERRSKVKCPEGLEDFWS